MSIMLQFFSIMYLTLELTVLLINPNRVDKFKNESKDEEFW